MNAHRIGSYFCFALYSLTLVLIGWNIPDRNYGKIATGFFLALVALAMYWGSRKAADEKSQEPTQGMR